MVKISRSTDLVIGVGEVLWDVFAEERKIGGAPANFAYHVSQFGLDGCIVSAVGNDAEGTALLDELRAMSLRTMIPEVPYPTGSVQVKLDGEGIPRYEIREQVAWDNIPFTPEMEEAARRATAVCFGTLAQRSPVSSASICRFLGAIPEESDCLKICDINLRQHYYTPNIVLHSLELCNVLKINDEELDVVRAMLDISGAGQPEICRMLLERFGLRFVILTCGVNGSYVFMPQEEVSFMETPKVGVADTVGAGDSFTAAFVASLLKGKDATEAHAIAVRTAAFVCSCQGAMPLLPPELTGV